MTPTQATHKLSDQAFATCVRARMHLPVYESDGTCLHRSVPRQGRPSVPCGSTRDRYGRHVLLCKVGGAVTCRHNALRDNLASSITAATSMPANVEQHSEAHEDNRRPDINFQNWRGEMIHIDVAVVTPHRGSHGGDPRTVREGAQVAGHENFKRRKYAALNLCPAVTTHLGRAGKDLVALFRSTCRHEEQSERSKAISGMWQSWSCCLQRWNAHILGAAGPLCPP